MREREINLKDLMTEILLKWRVFIVLILVCAVALGVDYASSWKAKEAQKANTEQTDQEPEEQETEETAPEKEIIQELEGQLTDLQISAVKYTIANEESLADRLAYEQQSALMKINADQVYRATATFYLSSDSREKTSSIVSLYEDLIRGTGLIDYVVKRTELKENDVTELVSLMGRTSAAVQEKDSFTVVVFHYSETGCRELLDAVTDFIYEKKNELAEIFDAYEITAVEPSLVTVNTLDYSDYQKNYLTDTLKLQQEIESSKGAFTEEQVQYYNVLSNEKITNQEEPQEIVTTVTPRSRAKYIVLGTVLAAFLYAFWLFAVYVFNTKIRTVDNLQELYDIPQLGMIPGEHTDRKLFGFMDKIVLRLRDRGKRSFSKEEALELTEAAIKLAAVKEALTTVYLVGCNLQGMQGEICDRLKEGLQKENIQVNVLNNILYDARTMKEIEKAEGAVLVEKAGSTFYSEISQESELLKRQGVRILGGVIVD